MQPYITFRDTDDTEELQYYVLQRDFPHVVSVLSDRPIVNFVQPVPLPDYNLFLNFDGCLRGRQIPGYKDIFEEIRVVLGDMSIWFFNNRILTNEKKYKKWKIQS